MTVEKHERTGRAYDFRREHPSSLFARLTSEHRLLLPIEAARLCGVQSRDLTTLGLPVFSVGGSKVRYDPRSVAAYHRDGVVNRDASLSAFLFALSELGPLSSRGFSNVLRLDVPAVLELFQTVATPGMRWYNVAALVAALLVGVRKDEPEKSHRRR